MLRRLMNPYGPINRFLTTLENTVTKNRLFVQYFNSNLFYDVDNQIYNRRLVIDGCELHHF